MMHLRHHLGSLNISNVSTLNPWMAQNRHKLYADKTQLIWLGTRQQLAKLTMKQLKLITSTVELDVEVNHLGVVFDIQLSMASHLRPSAFTRCVSWGLLNVHCQPTQRVQLPVQAFVHCRLDYCNSHLTGAAKRLQSVQNDAARLVSGARRHYVHLRLAGKRVVDFLLVLIEHFARCYCW